MVDLSNEEIAAQLLLRLGKKISVFMISKSRGAFLSLLTSAASTGAAPGLHGELVSNLKSHRICSSLMPLSRSS
jgi:hypothetical protein